MSCCDDDEKLPTVRHLIHDLSSYWVDQREPVYVDFMGNDGKSVVFVVTGVTVTARGQSLELRQVEDGAG